jgi:hypothetical protein
MWVDAVEQALACACSRVALLIQHATLHHIAVSGLSGSIIQFFSTFSHKRYDFRKKVAEHKMCILFSQQLLFETFLIPKRNKRDIVINVKTALCKIPVILIF